MELSPYPYRKSHTVVPWLFLSQLSCWVPFTSALTVWANSSSTEIIISLTGTSEILTINLLEKLKYKFQAKISWPPLCAAMLSTKIKQWFYGVTRSSHKQRAAQATELNILLWAIKESYRQLMSDAHSAGSQPQCCLHSQGWHFPPEAREGTESYTMFF